MLILKPIWLGTTTKTGASEMEVLKEKTMWLSSNKGQLEGGVTLLKLKTSMMLVQGPCRSVCATDRVV